MKYVALLRGINVGGNAIIKMADLKAAFEKGGYKNVITYIQSGNVIFESEKDSKKISKDLEEMLTRTFGYSAKVVVVSHDQINKVLENVPDEWKKEQDLRCYIAFAREPVTSNDVLKEIKLTEGVDFVKIEKGVLYMSTVMSGLTKSGFARLIGKKIYKEITMRNYNTSQKILKLME